MNKTAPEGQVYVCCACGKLSRDRYGELSISCGWDESCMLNCTLARESHLVLSNKVEFTMLVNTGYTANTRVTEIQDGGIVEGR